MDSIAKKKILITGGLGFIFSHVTEYFLNSPQYEVFVIDALYAGSHSDLLYDFKKLGLIFSQFNVAEPFVIPMIRDFDPDYIIHAAAISDVDASIHEPLKTIKQNNDATINVFEAARQCPNLKKLLYVSTDEVYGECDHPKTEEEIIFPRNPYSLSKAFGSLMRLTYDNTFYELRDKTCETRFCNVFGPRQDARKIIPAIKEAMNGGKPLNLHNEGAGFRQFIHVDEIPPLMELLLEKGTRTYNITSGEGYTVRYLISLAEELTGKKVPTVRSERVGMDIRYEMSSERIRKEFGWTPKKDFRERLRLYLR